MPMSDSLTDWCPVREDVVISATYTYGNQVTNSVNLETCDKEIVFAHEQEQHTFWLSINALFTC